ncbi:MAG: hypothetical protein HY560_12545 [Gemmatimonadetes bacterium]|nr:hypothetical protein [Gemmatimonadota bacterium]
MAPALLALLLFSTAPQARDTSTYADEATARLIALARQRHAVQDTLVRDYQALVRTRVDAGFGRRRFATIPPILAMETAARITWARPNDLKVEVLGTRTASTLRGVRASGTFEDPWFVPRGLSDTIRFVDDEIPQIGARHPLAADGPAFYRFAITDSLSIALPQRQVRAVGIRVEPKRPAPSLIAGNLWIDGETAEVVRMTLVFVGQYLWSAPDSATSKDSARALRENRRVNRILRVEAELEYGLHQARYWMPHRQLVTLTAEIPWFLSARIPVRFLSTFSQYRINTGAAPRFTLSPDDSTENWAQCRRWDRDDPACGARIRERRERVRRGHTRAERWGNGGRWEVAVPPRDSLAAYQWPDRLSLAPDPATEQLIRETAATLAAIDRGLPAEWVGRQTLGVAWDRVSDLFRFNRVQGPSLGAGIRLQPGPAFTSVLGSARIGISDQRLTGSVLLRRDAPGGRFEAGASRQVREAEPWSAGLGLGNSVNAIFAGHDDADYHLVLGGGVSFAANHGALRDIEWAVGFERHRPMAAIARSRINDWLGGNGLFQPNPAATAGDFARLSLTAPRRLGPLRAAVGAEGLAGNSAVASRVWGEVRLPLTIVGRTGSLTVRAGGVAGDSLPQLLFRLGGPATVRGYTYGFRAGSGGWAAQLDLGLSRRSVVAPVVFADVGDRFGSSDPLVSVGGGLSFFEGIVRLNWSKGLNPEVPVRFDLLFRAPR